MHFEVYNGRFSFKISCVKEHCRFLSMPIVAEGHKIPGVFKGKSTTEVNIFQEVPLNVRAPLVCR